MDQREHDHQELRPLGEASPAVDHELEENHENAHRTEPSTAGNSIQATQKRETESKCRSCGASIPSDRTKCLFCLTERIDPPDEATDEATENLLSIVFIVVPARTRYEAIAKGTAACRKLVADDGPIDGYQLVADIDEPAPQLDERWTSLPSAASRNSEPGEQLLEQLEDVVDEDSARWSAVGSEFPILYNEWGDATDDSEELSGLEDPYQWVVPALALHESSRSNQTTQPEPSIPRKTRLCCRHCDEETIHVFDGRDTASNSSVSSPPIWECNRCSTPRHGPALE
ncbi:hypothetical protein Halxa_0054 (plasmid) [Halopiger xanaduensis SH-6]|uniref:Uncharacterized protein n=1 Tax=Halopiger xanaduensis (strain DSM 18323 / JCM 14033 / SH-6) TaxID=797210 RepID=F8DE30_HALXS|nr:hypothetical protein Halxa_0054 [Halopiger xanaduensis SH-6]